MSVKRMDNVGIVVEDLDAATEFFTELGLEHEGRAPIEGDWANGVKGLRAMFTVDAIDDALARLGPRGAKLVGEEVVQYENLYRLCYIRGPEGILIGLAEQLGQPASRANPLR
jgi:catechol 2,3-dioxygenase-like lactoylglutathione lyase family enzyme